MKKVEVFKRQPGSALHLSQTIALPTRANKEANTANLKTTKSMLIISSLFIIK